MGIDIFIKGVPYSRWKVRGDREAAGGWTQDVIRQTKSLPRIHGRVSANLKFTLPLDKHPADFPNGPDLDNLLKRLFDALGKTILSEVAGGDSAIVRLTASKRKARKGEATGVRMILNEL